MDFENAANQLSAAAKDFHRRGWVLGTSGNFSAITSFEPLRVCITASGNDKGNLTNDDFVAVDLEGQVLAGEGRPSEECAIHQSIYGLVPDAGSVMHTHSVFGTVLSDLFFDKGEILIEGYEMLKGLAGIDTHEHAEAIPIIANSQDYDSLVVTVKNLLKENPLTHGIYLHRHGLYTWGNDIKEARRHVEILEFLFEVSVRRMEIRNP